MFRENVLMALTILITVLALSYIILMTVFMQISDMDRREKIHKKIMEHNFKESIKNSSIGETLDYLRKMQVQQEEIDKEREQIEKTLRSFDRSSSSIFQGRWVKENDSYKYPSVGFAEDKLPPDAIIFPYYFFAHNGQLLLRVPRGQSLDNLTIDLDDENILQSVVGRIHDRIAKVLENPIPIVHSQEGYIWFRKEYLENMTSIPDQHVKVFPKFVDIRSTTEKNSKDNWNGLSSSSSSPVIALRRKKG